MLFHDLIRRKISDLLRPWLREELELELKMGLLRSHGVVKNLSFDTSVLNASLGDSTPIFFSDFRIDQLTLRISNWYFPAITIDVRGLHATLSMKTEETGVTGRRRPTDTSSEDKKRILSEIDAQGSALHDTIGRISGIFHPRNRMVSFLHYMLANSCLYIHDVHLLIQSSISSDFSYLLDMDELKVESQYSKRGCFLLGCISSLFVPFGQGTFNLTVRDLECRLKNKDLISCVFPSACFLTSFQLKDFQLLSLDFFLPKLKILLSPSDVFIISTFSAISTREGKSVRHGKQLWRIAASRICSLLPNARISWYNVIRVIRLWLRYVRAYKDLLLLVGYPVDTLMKRSAVKMSCDKAFSRSLKQQWELVSEIERDLPSGAIAQARKIARYGAAFSIQEAKDSFNKTAVKDHSKAFWKLHQPLYIIWTIVLYLLNSILLLPFLQSFQHDHLKDKGVSGVICMDYFQQPCISVNVGAFSIIVSPGLSSVLTPVTDNRISYVDLFSFHFFVDALFIKYTADVVEQSILFFCGQLKVFSLTAPESSSMIYASYLEGHTRKKFHNSKTVLWSEPPQVGYSSETIGSSSAYQGIFDNTLESTLEELHLNWKKCHVKLEGSKIENLESPFVLCEIKSFLTDQTLKNPTSGFLKCSLAVGKMNVVLDQSSIVSVALLVIRMQQALCLHHSNKMAKDLVSPTVTIDPPLRDWNGNGTSYLKGFEWEMLKMLPEKHIQIGASVAGPHIQIILQNKCSHLRKQDMTGTVKHDSFYLTFNVHDIVLFVSPASESDISFASGCKTMHEAEPEGSNIWKTKEIDILKSDKEDSCQGQVSLDVNLKFNGFSVCMGGSADTEQFPIVLLYPTTFQWSSLRKEICSFVATVVSFSGDIHWITSGLTIMLFVNELYVFFEEATAIFSSLSHAFTTSNSVYDINCQEISVQMKLYDTTESQSAPMSRRECESFLLESLLIGSTFELMLVDIVVHNSRKSYNKESFLIDFEKATTNRLPTQSVPDHGICFSVERACVKYSLEKGKMQMCLDFSNLFSVIFEDPIQISTDMIQSEVKNLVLHSLSRLYEFSLLYFKLSLVLEFLQNGFSSEGLSDATNTSTNEVDFSHLSELNPSSPASEISTYQAFSFFQRIGFVPVFGNWLHAEIVISDIYLVECPMKNELAGAHKLNALGVSASVGGRFQTTSCKSQGGLIILDTVALVIFVQCFTSYYWCVNDLAWAAPLSELLIWNKIGRNVATHNAHPDQSTEKILKVAEFETIALDLSRFLLVLVSKESGRIQELVLELDVHSSFEVTNARRKFSLGISNLSILSQFLHENIEKQNEEIQTTGLSSPFLHEDLTEPWIDKNHAVLDDLGCSSSSISQNKPSLDNSALQILHLSPHSHIVKELNSFLTVEWNLPVVGTDILSVNHVWAGRGFISGVDVTISLLEIQMILCVVESFSGVFGGETTVRVEQMQWSINNQEPGRIMEEMVPDGSVVAIQDVHQHMYIAVDGAGSKYSLTSALHYSLVGERALFRVKYQTPRRWKSSVQWFSLISLHAKNNNEESLRLNYHPRSSFVDISSVNEHACALWRVLPYRPETYKGDIELESYNPVYKNMFYLVNKKSNRAVSVVDGIPEFVSNLGNPFKWKVFNHSQPSGTVPVSSGSLESSSNNFQNTDADGRPYRPIGMPPCINVTVDRANLTIVHELSDTREKFPLLRGFISSTEIIVQYVHSKLRVMSRLSISLHCFDAQRNLWKEFVDLAELCIFYRSRFSVQASETVSYGVPVQFYVRINECSVLLTELSLDILLFVVGKLNLAGPYAVRRSAILANFCKVDNCSGLTLFGQFHGNQDAVVARRQSKIFYSRYMALANQHLEASFFSMQLVDCSGLSTAPIKFSLLEARTFAYRTRILSVQDPRTYPGPVVVVESAQENENGLSIIISPLLRIHNETDFPMELWFQRPQKQDIEFASMVLKKGDTFDDSTAAFDAITLPGGSKKALMSLSVGNFLLSFRPKLMDDNGSLGKLLVGWSEELKGGKAIHLSGLFNKLSYQVRKAISVESVKYSLRTACCSLKSEDGHSADLHFLIQTTSRDVPLVKSDNSGFIQGNANSDIALQEQKEMTLLPTVQVSNLLEMEIYVALNDTDAHAIDGSCRLGNQATIPCGSSANFYSNPAVIYFSVSLIALGSTCKPVNSGDWVKKSQKHKQHMHHLDVELEFGGGMYFAFLRLSCGDKGILQVTVFTKYTIKNETHLSFLCFMPNRKLPSREEIVKHGSIPPELGYLLGSMSTKSWLMRYNKLHLKLLDENASEAKVDLDALSGLTEITLVVEEYGRKAFEKFGVSLIPSISRVVPSQVITLSPRYIVLNESTEVIIFRQCHLEHEMEGFSISSKQKMALRLQEVTRKQGKSTIFENFVRKHKNSHDDSLLFIQFRPNKVGLNWSGPICLTSLGRFFLKFKRSLEIPIHQEDCVSTSDRGVWEFAAVHVVEEGPTLVLHFHRPSNVDLPYRIENCLRSASITYYQKGSLDQEVLGSGDTVNYVWDDLTLSHKLVVQINDVNLLREINIDKVRSWKPFYKVRQHRGFGFHLPLSSDAESQKSSSHTQLNGVDIIKWGYEIYADGLTRVLRFCEFSDGKKGDSVFRSNSRMQLRVSYFAIRLLDYAKQDQVASESSAYSPILVTKLGNVNLEAIFTNQHKCFQMRVQSLSVDPKWDGAPFAAMLRNHQLAYSDAKDNTLEIVLVLLSSTSNVKLIKHLSIVLQPLDLNLDEETLMRVVPFWRTSLSDSKTSRQQYYFDHFEVHPIKIVASFLPNESYSSYNSTQETLRSFLHSVIKIPTIRNKNVELNGVLVTHALTTLRELTIKCAQHYSWYAMRAIYIAKGSLLLPPTFASLFDDLASSSLDVFFDPSSSLINLPGITLGTFKLISKCIDGKGFFGTKRYFGDLGKTLKMAGSNVLFAAVTEISDSVLKGAEANGINGMMIGFHQGILKLAMEPSVLGNAFMDGGPNRKIKLDKNLGIDELYIEGYLQAMLDTLYKQEYLRVRVVDNQVVLKNLPPNSSLIDEIVKRVEGFLVSKALLKGDTSTSSHSLRHLRGESEWRLGPTLLTLCEHLFVSFAIRMLRRQAGKVLTEVKSKRKSQVDDTTIVPRSTNNVQKANPVWKWGVSKFILSGIIAYIDGRLCRCIPHPIVRRIVSGFLLSFLDKDDNK